jgi:hypothetical protein
MGASCAAARIRGRIRLKPAAPMATSSTAPHRTVRSAPATSLPPTALAAMAVALAIDPATTPPPGEGRRWRRLVAADRYEAWVIAWPPGTGLALHDHAGSAAGVAMVAGRLRERYLADGALQTRWWRPGDAFALGADHAHEVLSLDAAEAVSVHVYSPPLGEVRFRTELGID